MSCQYIARYCMRPTSCEESKLTIWCFTGAAMTLGASADARACPGIGGSGLGAAPVRGAGTGGAADMAATAPGGIVFRLPGAGGRGFAGSGRAPAAPLTVELNETAAFPAALPTAIVFLSIPPDLRSEESSETASRNASSRSLLDSMKLFRGIMYASFWPKRTPLATVWTTLDRSRRWRRMWEPGAISKRPYFCGTTIAGQM
mmetsp:Transcript_10875/g.44522  ORF Transcript_10875/g.44522 Transcript_10875/m.44522 type:complete len:202 (+) Transcript_10875:359-964(+)